MSEETTPGKAPTPAELRERKRNGFGARSGAQVRQEREEEALAKLEELEVGDGTGQTFKDVCKIMRYHPMMEVIRLLKANNKKGGISQTKRLDANLKLMDFLVPKLKSVDGDAGKDQGFTMKINDEEVK